MKSYKVNVKVVGDRQGKYKKPLRQKVTQEGIEKYVEFMGYVDNPVLVQQKADIILVCSRAEVFGRVTIERYVGKEVCYRRSLG